MVHAVQYRIGSGTKIRGTLCNVGKGKKEFLPEFIHYKHAVRGVTMQEECLRKKRKVPVKDKEQKNDGHFVLV
jgi:hypothetical protein